MSLKSGLHWSLVGVPQASHAGPQISLRSSGSFAKELEGKNIGTIAAWIFSQSDISGSAVVWTLPTAGNGEIRLLRENATGNARFEVRWATTVASPTLYTDANTVGTNNTIMLVTVVRDGTNLHVYRDATLVKTFGAIGPDYTDNVYSANANATIGNGTNGFTVFDLHAWKRALNATEVASLYAAGFGVPPGEGTTQYSGIKSHRRIGT